MKKILLVFGTRPEAIKMAPLYNKLKVRPELFDVKVCVTGQHREMLDQVLSIFGIIPEYDLNIMEKGQDLFDITQKVLSGIKVVIKEVNPDLVMVHGDTTTSMVTALGAYYLQIPIAHVEAGLRTYNIYSPWPEELNRQITSRIALFNFAPTPMSKKNLISEGVKDENIFVTGNTVIDALLEVVGRIQNSESLRNEVAESIQSQGYNLSRLNDGRRLVLITGHRRENFGEGFLNICKALEELAKNFPMVDFVYPMHLNPNVRNPIKKVFNGDTLLQNIFFIEPLSYLPFVFLMSKSYFVLTDSGGIQEEAPGLGKPVLVMRNTTERPEAVEAGTVRLVGTSKNRIFFEASRLLNDKEEYQKMSKAINPFGDGRASDCICEILINRMKEI